MPILGRPKQAASKATSRPEEWGLERHGRLRRKISSEAIKARRPLLAKSALAPMFPAELPTKDAANPVICGVSELEKFLQPPFLAVRKVPGQSPWGSNLNTVR